MTVDKKLHTFDKSIHEKYFDNLIFFDRCNGKISNQVSNQIRSRVSNQVKREFSEPVRYQVFEQVKYEVIYKVIDQVDVYYEIS